MQVTQTLFTSYFLLPTSYLLLPPSYRLRLKAASKLPLISVLCTLNSYSPNPSGSERMKRMKKLLCLALCLALSVTSLASALNYSPYLDNPSTFETLEEALANGPAFLTETFGGAYCNNPCLADYPQGTTWVYRSAARWTSGSAGYRKNTTILVYTDEKFADKDAALNYLKGLGLVDIIEECKGSVVLVNPIGDAFANADQYAYYLLQTAMCNLGGSAMVDGANMTTAEGAYFGGTTFRYLIGIGGGATFINNYIASNFDYITRIAGLLLIDGHIDRIRNVAGVVPTYLVNCTDRVLDKYRAANATDARGYKGDVDYYFNQQLPLQIVYDAHPDTVDLGAWVKEAYYGMFIKAERIPVVKANLYNASTLYTDVNWNQAPYSLGPRNAFFGYKTADGLVIDEVHSTRFEEYKNGENEGGFWAAPGEYIDMWFEIMPEEVVSGKSAEHSVPLVLALHGMGDDPLQFVDEMGLLNVAGKERFAILAPYHLVQSSKANIVLPAMVEYLLEKFPALDPTRVYVTGYSMGGAATLRCVNGNNKLFAAAVPHAAAIFGGPDETVNQDDVQLPIMFTTATYDFCGFGGVTGFAGNPNPDDPYEPEHLKPVLADRINMYMQLNGFDQIDYDYEKYEISGFRASSYKEITLNNEYRNYTWLFENEAGVPMVGLNVTDFLPHGLYQEFGQITWDFVKHYSRNLETGEVIYNPAVD